VSRRLSAPRAYVRVGLEEVRLQELQLLVKLDLQLGHARLVGITDTQQTLEHSLRRHRRGIQKE
jgi:hypothetical protein